MSYGCDRCNIIQIQTDSEESLDPSSLSSEEESTSSESLDFENENNIFLTKPLKLSLQQNFNNNKLQKNFNYSFQSVSSPDFYCVSCKNRYFINIKGSTMTHCALCSSSTNKLHTSGGSNGNGNGNGNGSCTSVNFSDYNGWKEFTKGWSGL